MIQHALSRWDRTARLVVLAFAVTACVTAMLGVMSGMLGAASAGVVAVAAASWLRHRSKATAAAE